MAMGRAIVRDPQVFLFDEPLSNLDAKLRVAMRVEIKELHQRLGTTIVYVAHDPDRGWRAAFGRGAGRWPEVQMEIEEIEDLRQRVGCQAVLETGFARDRKERKRRAIKFRRGAEIIN